MFYVLTCFLIRNGLLRRKRSTIAGGGISFGAGAVGLVFTFLFAFYAQIFSSIFIQNAQVGLGTAFNLATANIFSSLGLAALVTG